MPIGSARVGVLGGGGSDILDSGILHEWPVSDTTTPVPDTESSADITLNGAGFDTSTDTWWDGHAVSFDGTDDYGIVNSNRTDPGDSGTLILTTRWQSLSGRAYAFSHPDSGNDNRLYVVYNDAADEFVVWVGDSSLTVDASPTSATTQRIGITWDSGTLEGWVNGSSQGTTSYTSPVSLTTEPWYFGVFDATTQYGNVFVDYPRISTDVFTATEMSDDYTAQPWS